MHLTQLFDVSLRGRADRVGLEFLDDAGTVVALTFGEVDARADRMAAGLWAGAVYEPTAITTLARQAGMSAPAAARMVSLATAVLSVGTILGCLCLPMLAEKWGRRRTLALYFGGMMVTIPLAFGWAFYQSHGLTLFIVILFFMGFAGGNFAAFSLWLPEQYDTRVRATAFAFTTSVGRFVGAGVNFALAAAVLRAGSLGIPVALTALAFGLGLLVIPFATETRGQRLPE